ncbi:MAG: hypothetical protein AAF986_02485 [Pseudomonadota bacterium]
MISATVFRRYLVPGFVFQSVIVGGGYGTGREIAEFFLGHGGLGGLMGMVVAACAWSVVLAIAFEFARLTKSYNYRAFFRALLGPFWRLFELVYLLIAVLVLAVLGAAAGELVSDVLGMPSILGTLILLGAVGGLAYWGSQTVEKALAYWSILLYIVYGIFLVWVLLAFSGDISTVLAEREFIGAWHWDGLRYAAYNLNALAAVLFVLPRLETRREALTSGVIAGLIGIIPGIFVFIAMLAQYPDIAEAAVPITTLLQSLNAVWFLVVFQIILFGTFIETGAGIVHSFNERIADAFAEKNLTFPQWTRFAVAVVTLGAAVFLADAIGIIGLIAKGYGTLSYAFVAIVILPLLTLGLFKIVKHSS